MKTHHLSKPQIAALSSLLAKYGDTRPTSKEYAKEENLLRSAIKTNRPKARKIPETWPGFESSEVKLKPEFDAVKCLPEGWCVFSRFDSGGNHGIENAAVNVWRDMWNGWHRAAITLSKAT
jgi:hypothetical protein